MLQVNFEVSLSLCITLCVSAGGVSQNSCEENKGASGKFRLKAAHLLFTPREWRENITLFTDFTTPIHGIFVGIIYFICLFPQQLIPSHIKKKRKKKHIGATFHELLNVTFWRVIVSPSLTTNQAAVCLALQIQQTWKIPLIFKVCLFARWFFPPSLSNFENYNLSKTKNISVMDR